MLREAVMEHLDSNVVLLDVGAGSGLVDKMNFLGMAEICMGLDPDAGDRESASRLLGRRCSGAYALPG